MPLKSERLPKIRPGELPLYKGIKEGNLSTSGKILNMARE